MRRSEERRERLTAACPEPEGELCSAGPEHHLHLQGGEERRSEE